DDLVTGVQTCALPISIATSVFEQVRALAGIAAGCGVRLAHVKPHGALYNQAVRNREIAGAIAKGVARWNRDMVLVGLAGSPMLRSEERRVGEGGGAGR